MKDVATALAVPGACLGVAAFLDRLLHRRRRPRRCPHCACRLHGPSWRHSPGCPWGPR